MKKYYKLTGRIMAAVLSAVMIFTSVPTASITAFASDNSEEIIDVVDEMDSDVVEQMSDEDEFSDIQSLEDNDTENDDENEAPEEIREEDFADIRLGEASFDRALYASLDSVYNKPDSDHTGCFVFKLSIEDAGYYYFTSDYRFNYNVYDSEHNLTMSYSDLSSSPWYFIGEYDSPQIIYVAINSDTYKNVSFGKLDVDISATAEGNYSIKLEPVIVKMPDGSSGRWDYSYTTTSGLTGAKKGIRLTDYERLSQLSSGDEYSFVFHIYGSNYDLNYPMYTIEKTVKVNENSNLKAEDIILSFSELNDSESNNVGLKVELPSTYVLESHPTYSIYEGARVIIKDGIIYDTDKRVEFSCPKNTSVNYSIWVDGIRKEGVYTLGNPLSKEEEYTVDFDYTSYPFGIKTDLKLVKNDGTDFTAGDYDVVFEVDYIRIREDITLKEAQKELKISLNTNQNNNNYVLTPDTEYTVSYKITGPDAFNYTYLGTAKTSSQEVSYEILVENNKVTVKNLMFSKMMGIKSVPVNILVKEDGASAYRLCAKAEVGSKPQDVVLNNFKQGTFYEIVITACFKNCDINVATDGFFMRPYPEEINVDVKTGYSYAEFDVNLDCFYQDKTMYLGAYYNNLANFETYYTNMDSSDEEFSFNSVTAHTKKYLCNLKPGIYKYAFYATEERINVTDYTMFGLHDGVKATGTFTITGKSDYQAFFEMDNDKSRPGLDVMKFMLLPEKSNDDKVKAKVTIANCNDPSDVYERTTTLYKSANYCSNINWTGLRGSATYYIKSVEVIVDEPGNEGYVSQVITILTGMNEFVAKGIAPSSVKLSDSAVYVLKDSSKYNGSVNVIMEPANANADITLRYGVGEVDSSEMVDAYVSNNVIKIRGRKVGTEYIYVNCGDFKKQLTVHIEDGFLSYITDASPSELSTVNLAVGEKSDKIGFYGWTDGQYKWIAASSISLISGQDYVSVEDSRIVAKAPTYGTETIEVEFDWGINKFRTTIKINISETYNDFTIAELVSRKPLLPGVKQGEKYVIAYAPDNSGSETYLEEPWTDEYQITGYLSDSTVYINGDNFIKYFKVYSTNTSVVDVTESGYITVNGVGQAKIMITPTEEYGIRWGSKATTKEISLDVRELPAETNFYIYTLENVQKQLKDISLPEGWVWVDSVNTPVLGTSDRWYYQHFDAKYTGDDKYPIEKNVPVKSFLITGVNGNVSYSAKDTLDSTGKLTASFGAYYAFSDGVGPSNDYEYESLKGNAKYNYEISCSDKSVVVGSHTGYNDRTDITFSKPGTYKFTVSAVDGSGKVLAKSKFTYTVYAYGDEKMNPNYCQVFQTVAGVKTPVDLKNGILGEKLETRELEVITKKNSTDVVDVEVTWKSSDSSVAVVSADKKDSRKAKITFKKPGSAVISIKEKKRGDCLTFVVENRDYTPRVDKSSVKVNTAYDYLTNDGEILASEFGSYVCIEPQYMESIYTVDLYERTSSKWETQNTKTVVSDLALNKMPGNKYLITPDTSLTKGSKKLWLVVLTNGERGINEYSFPITVSVINQKPKLTAKVKGTTNLFYKNRNGQSALEISSSQNIRITSIYWEDYDPLNSNFILNKSEKVSGAKGNIYSAPINYDSVTVINGKLANAGADKGDVIVYVAGINDPYVFKNVSIPTTYKKPVLTTDVKNSVISTKAGINTGHFRVYDSTDKSYPEYLEYYTNQTDFEISGSDEVEFKYLGEKSSEKLNLTVSNNMYWRENLTVSHTIKNVTPTADLSLKAITLNSNMNTYTASTSLVIKGVTDASEWNCIDSIAVKGNNENAQKLIDSKLITIGKEKLYSTSKIVINQNSGKDNSEKLAPGSYVFTITPKVRVNGRILTLNDVKLTLKVVNKPASMKASAGGTIDIIKKSGLYSNGHYSNVIKVKRKAVNMPEDYHIESVSLKGAYSTYFAYLTDTVDGDIIYVKDEYGAKKLISGTNVVLTAQYTITWVNELGNVCSMNVDSSPIKFKTTKSKPAVKVVIDNNVVCINDGNKDYENIYPATLIVPEGYYISSAYGSLKVNDYVEMKLEDRTSSEYGTSYGLKLSVSSSDTQLIAPKTGKTYYIPVTLKMRGDDNRGSDIVVKVPVVVKY